MNGERKLPNREFRESVKGKRAVIAANRSVINGVAVINQVGSETVVIGNGVIIAGIMIGNGRKNIVVSKYSSPRGERPKICPRCGALMPPDASYCGMCGARLA